VVFILPYVEGYMIKTRVAAIIIAAIIIRVTVNYSAAKTYAGGGLMSLVATSSQDIYHKPISIHLGYIILVW
jgi:hypothetical protein